MDLSAAPVRYGTAAGRWVLLATVLGSSLAFIDATVVNIALPAIGRDLGSDAAGLQWTVNGYALSLAALILLGGSLAVVVESIQPHRMSEIVVRGRGLTAREREVLALVARGHANRTIARELRLSEYTVQDHLKAIFAKFGVASRNELVAALFFDHYAPLHAADGPVRA